MPDRAHTRFETLRRSNAAVEPVSRTQQRRMMEDPNASR